MYTVGLLLQSSYSCACSIEPCLGSVSPSKAFSKRPGCCALVAVRLACAHAMKVKDSRVGALRTFDLRPPPLRVSFSFECLVRILLLRMAPWLVPQLVYTAAMHTQSPLHASPEAEMAVSDNDRPLQMGGFPLKNKPNKRMCLKVCQKQEGSSKWVKRAANPERNVRALRHIFDNNNFRLHHGVPRSHWACYSNWVPEERSYGSRDSQS